MAAKGMALAEFLVRIGFNTAQINKQLDAIEKRLDTILAKRRSVTGKALRDEKSLLDLKRKELGVATAEQRLAQQRARTVSAEARSRITVARAEARAASAQRRAGTGPNHPGRPFLNRRLREERRLAREQALQGPAHPGRAYLNQRRREEQRRAREQALQGPAHPGRAYLNQIRREEQRRAREQALQGPPRPPANRGGGSGGGRGNNAQNLAERRGLLMDRLETYRAGGRISATQHRDLVGRINSATDLRGLAIARGHLANAAAEAARLRRELTLSNIASQRLASSTRQMLGNYFSVFAMASGGAMVGRSSMAVESARAQLFGANFGDQAAANSDYDFFRQMSLQYGTGMAESIKSFSGFKYAGGNIMNTAQMRELFQSMTLAGVAGGATQADMSRTFYALKQMASKGKISSEELNLQLAEANPLAKLGIEKAFEEFTGLDRSEMMDMMKRGEVYAKDILPLVAKHLNEISAKGVTAGMKTASKQLDIMTANAVEFAAVFGESGGNEGLAEIFKALTKVMQASAPVIKSVGVTFKYLGQAISWVLGSWSKMVESVAALSESLSGQGGLIHGIAALAAALKFKGIPAFKWFAAAIAIPLAKAILLFGTLEEIANWALPNDHPMKKIGVLSQPTGYDMAGNKLGPNDPFRNYTDIEKLGIRLGVASDWLMDQGAVIPAGQLKLLSYAMSPKTTGQAQQVNNFYDTKVEVQDPKDSEGFVNSLISATEAARAYGGF